MIRKTALTRANLGAGSNTSALIEVRPAELTPLPGHPFKLKPNDIERAKLYVARHASHALPIIIDDDNHIIAGEIFGEAAKALGLKTIKVIRQSGLSSTEALLCGTAITKLQSLGRWDAAALEAAVREFEIFIDDFSSALIGWAPGELDRAIGASLVSPDADTIPEPLRYTVSKLGMMWGCGDHSVLCGDATDVKSFQKALGSKKARVASVDGPYGCKVDGFVSSKGKHRDFVQGAGEMDKEALEQFFARFCQAMSGVLMPGALIYLYIDWRSLSILQRAAEGVFGPLVNLCVWGKDRAGMGSFYRSQHELVLVFAMPGGKPLNNIELGRHGRDRSNLWSYPAAASSRKGREGDMLRNHPTPKPVEMVAESLIDSSLRGDIVLDCFLGSGTTLIAAERTGRVLKGIELDPVFVDVAVRRWQTWTGRDAIDLASGRTFNDLATEAENG